METTTPTEAPAETTPLVSVSEHDLAMAFAEWEQEHRDGKCAPYDPTFSTPVEQVARENASHFFARLQRATAEFAG
jgi:hypothetical protein